MNARELKNMIGRRIRITFALYGRISGMQEGVLFAYQGKRSVVLLNAWSVSPDTFEPVEYIGRINTFIGSRKFEGFELIGDSVMKFSCEKCRCQTYYNECKYYGYYLPEKGYCWDFDIIKVWMSEFCKTCGSLDSYWIDDDHKQYYCNSAGVAMTKKNRSKWEVSPTNNACERYWNILMNCKTCKYIDGIKCKLTGDSEASPESTYCDDYDR